MSGVNDGFRGEPRLEDFPSLQVFGTALATTRTDRRARRRGLARSLPRGLTFGSVGVAGLIVTGTAAAGLTALTGSPIPAPLRSDDTVTVLPEVGGATVAGSRAADPAGGPPWAVRVGSADGGLVCAGVGQVRAGRFGIVGVDARFRELPDVVGAGCVSAPTPRQPIVAARAVAGDRRDAYGAPESGTTVLYGLGGSRLRTAVVRMPDGRVLRPRVGSGGVFVMALRGLPEQTQPVVDLAWRDGERRRVDLRRLSTVPDPQGRAPWNVSGTDQVTVATRAGKSRPAPPRGPGPSCFSVLSRTGGAPSVCGTAGRGSWALRTRGAPSPREGQAGSDRWSGPARTLVLVRAAPGSTPVVRAAGRVWPVRWAGSFGTARRFDRRDVGWVAVLPATIAADAVRVQATSGGAEARPAPARYRTDEGGRR